MEKVSLQAQQRTDIGKKTLKSLRKDGFLPCVIYSQGKTLNIAVNKKEFIDLYHHSGENVIVNFNIKDDKKKQRSALIKQMQIEPVKGDVLHVDFQEISLKEKIKVNVKVEAKGEAIGVKQDSGVLEHVLWEVEVECLPTEIPEKLYIDVSDLGINDSLMVKDIASEKNIAILTDPESVVFTVKPPISEEDLETAPEEEATSEPEVISEKKSEEKQEASE